jgi:hemerythrin-like domain-containing protein
MIGAAIEYIEAFPESLHHPKEEKTLFARLRLRAPQSAPLLDALERQHRDCAQVFRELRQAHAADLPAFGLALAAFARSQWQHMRTEESRVLPMPSEHLRAED